MKKLFITVMVMVLTFTTVPAFAQPAKEALMALKKLQARCQSGISYKDYSSALGETKFPVNLFMESAEAKAFPELNDSIDKVMQHYENAKTIWNYKFSFRSPTYSIDAEEELGREIGKLYPQAPQSSLFGHKFYEIDTLLPMIWTKASEELENTTKLYAAKTEKDQSNDIDKLKKENEQLKADTEAEKLKAENENLKKQLELMKSKRKN